jgi:SOS response regulatory protein OraA/RecX
LKSYITEGLRRDEAQFDRTSAHKLAQVLKRRGVDEKVIDKALAEIDMK